MIDDYLLTDFAETFYGYGNYKGHYWLVGIEERCEDIDDTRKRLLVWDSRKRKELEQVSTFHKAIGRSELFSGSRKLDKTQTWNKLIRILLSAEGRLLETKDLKGAELWEAYEEQRNEVWKYQCTELGQESGQNCLIELFPLPSPSSDRRQWIYTQYSELQSFVTQDIYKQRFANGDIYESFYMPKRVEHIRERINQYKPRIVVFYSTTSRYRACWKQIAGTPFSLDLLDSKNAVEIGRGQETLFVIIDHPSRRWGNAYFHKVGKLIASESA